MINAKTRKQWKTRLALTEALNSSTRVLSVEEALQTLSTAKVVSETKKQSLRQKRKLADVIDQDNATCGAAILRCSRRDSGDQHSEELRVDCKNEGMGRSDPRVSGNQQSKNRVLLEAVDRAKERGTDHAADNETNSGIPVQEAEDYSEGTKGKRKSLRDRVWKPGKRKQGVVGNEQSPAAIVNSTLSGDPNLKRKRGNPLAGIGVVSQDIVNSAGPLTRRMAKTGLHGETTYVHRKKFKPSKFIRKGSVSVSPEGDSFVPISGSELGSLDKSAELDTELATQKSRAPPDCPDITSSLRPGRLESGQKTMTALQSCNIGKRAFQIDSRKESGDIQVKVVSSRITRGMKDTGLGSSQDEKGISRVEEDLKSGDTIDEEIDVAAVDGAAVIRTTGMKLRSQKEAGHVQGFSASERLSNRRKKKKKQTAVEIRVEGMNVRSDDSAVNNITAKGIRGLPTSDAVTRDNQVNCIGTERTGNALIVSNGSLEVRGNLSPEQVKTSIANQEGIDGGRKIGLAKRIVAGGSKVHTQSAVDAEVEPGFHDIAVGHLGQPIEGLGKVISHRRKTPGAADEYPKRKSVSRSSCVGGLNNGRVTEGSGGFSKKFEGQNKSHITETVLDEPEDDCEQQAHQDTQTKAPFQLVPGPIDMIERGLGEQRIRVQHIEENLQVAETKVKLVDLGKLGNKNESDLGTTVEPALVNNSACQQSSSGQYQALKMLQAERQDPEWMHLGIATLGPGPRESDVNTLQRTGEKAGSPEEIGRLRSSSGSPYTKLVKVSKHSKRKWKGADKSRMKTRTGTVEGTDVASSTSMGCPDICTKNPELESGPLMSSTGKKGGRRKFKEVVRKRSVGGVDLSLESADGSLLIQDGDSCHGAEREQQWNALVNTEGQKTLSKGPSVLKVTTSIHVATGSNSKEDPANVQPIKVTELCLDPAFAPGIVRSEGSERKAILWDDAQKATREVSWDRLEGLSQPSETNCGVVPLQVAPKRKSALRRKNLGCKANYTIITRARDIQRWSDSNVGRQGGVTVAELDPATLEQGDVERNIGLENSEGNDLRGNVLIMETSSLAAVMDEGIVPTSEKNGPLAGTKDASEGKDEVELGDELDGQNEDGGVANSVSSVFGVKELSWDLDGSPGDTLKEIYDAGLAANIKTRNIHSWPQEEGGVGLTGDVVMLVLSQLANVGGKMVEPEKLQAPGSLDLAVPGEVMQCEGQRPNLLLVLNEFEDVHSSALQGRRKRDGSLGSDELREVPQKVVGVPVETSRVTEGGLNFKASEQLLHNVEGISSSRLDSSTGGELDSIMSVGRSDSMMTAQGSNPLPTLVKADSISSVDKLDKLASAIELNCLATFDDKSNSLTTLDKADSALCVVNSDVRSIADVKVDSHSSMEMSGSLVDKYDLSSSLGAQNIACTQGPPQSEFVACENGSARQDTVCVAEGKAIGDDSLTGEEAMICLREKSNVRISPVATVDSLLRAEDSAVPVREPAVLHPVSVDKGLVGLVSKKTEGVASYVLAAQTSEKMKGISAVHVPSNNLAQSNHVPQREESDTSLARDAFSNGGLDCSTSSQVFPQIGNRSSLQVRSCTELLQSLDARVKVATPPSHVNSMSGHENRIVISQSLLHNKSQLQSWKQLAFTSFTEALCQQVGKADALSGNSCSLESPPLGHRNKSLQQNLQGEVELTIPVLPKHRDLLVLEKEDLLTSGNALSERRKGETAALAISNYEPCSLSQVGATIELMLPKFPHLTSPNKELSVRSLDSVELELCELAYNLQEQDYGSQGGVAALQDHLPLNEDVCCKDFVTAGSLKSLHCTASVLRGETKDMKASCPGMCTAVPAANEEVSDDCSPSKLILEGIVMPDQAPDKNMLQSELEITDQCESDCQKLPGPICEEKICVTSDELYMTISNVKLEKRLHVDAEVKEHIIDESTGVNKNLKEILEGDNVDVPNLQKLSTSQKLVASSRSDVVGMVTEKDIRRPLSPAITLTLGGKPVTDLMREEFVELENANLAHLANPPVATCLSDQHTHEFGLLPPIVENSSAVKVIVWKPEQTSDVQMETLVQKEGVQKSLHVSLEGNAAQCCMADGVKAPNASKKRKGRIGSESTKETDLQLQKRAWDAHEGGDRDEDGASRMDSRRKGFLLVSTSVETGGMRIRPRPLDPDLAMPIFLEGRDKEYYEYDGGSFVRWVQQQEEARLKKLAVDTIGAVSEGGVSSTASKPCPLKRRPILIPLFRKLPEDHQTLVDIEKGQDKVVKLLKQSTYGGPHGYLRHTKVATRKHGHALGGSFATVPSVYDMDDEDDEWLKVYNASLEQACPGQTLSENAFEQLIELFEREFFRILQNRRKSFPAVRGDQSKKDGVSGRGFKKLEGETSQETFQQGRLQKRLTKDTSRVSKSKPVLEGQASQNMSEECCICNGGENSANNLVFKCQLCSINVHQSCYGVFEIESNEFCHQGRTPTWSCRKCEAVIGGSAPSTISCTICCKSGGALKPTVDLSKWAHVACALYTNETFFIDPEAMEPVDGLLAVETRVRKQRERCGLCGVREGSCVRCSSRGCRAPFHISCGVSQGASFELRHAKQQVVGVRSFCPRHATFVPVPKLDEKKWATSARWTDPSDLLPAVSTESSDSLEIGQCRQQEVQIDGKRVNAIEDEITYVAEWPIEDADLVKQGQWEGKGSSSVRKKRSGILDRVATAGMMSPLRLHPSGGHVDVLGTNYSKTCTRSGSISELNIQGLPMATSGSPTHLSSTSESLQHIDKNLGAANVDQVALEFKMQEGLTDRRVMKGGDRCLQVPENSVTKSVSAEGAQSSASDLPKLETLDTNVAPPQVVNAVYTFWQSKRVKARGPILPELKQIQEARKQGIFNKVVQQRNKFLPVLGHDLPARMPRVRRPRSSIRDPVLSKILESRQQLEVLRTIAQNVVRREELKRADQELFSEIAQQKLLLAREKPRSSHCHWCANTQNLLRCSTCPKAFCFWCFKHRRGYGVKGWIAASKLSKYLCNFCGGSTLQETRPELGDRNVSTSSDPSVSTIAKVPCKLVDQRHGLEVNAKPSPVKEVSLNERILELDTTNNVSGSGSSYQKAVWDWSPGDLEMMGSDQVADGQVADKNSAGLSTIETREAVNRGYNSGIFQSGVITDGKVGRVLADHHHEAGKKFKKRRVRALKKQVEMQTISVPRTTNRIKKLARSSSFVYGSEDETSLSESDESLVEKKTVKLSQLRDTVAMDQCTNLKQVPTDAAPEKELYQHKFGIRFSSGVGKLILKRHAVDQGNGKHIWRLQEAGCDKFA